MEVTSNIETVIADRVGQEWQRAAAVEAQFEEPWDVPEVPHTISVDERAMLCSAREGVSWPSGTVEEAVCEWLEEHGLLLSSGEGEERVWRLTDAGAKLAHTIEEKNEDLRCSCHPSAVAALAPRPDSPPA